ncbi:uncharacterized protein [Pocillopora verrucosa]|uniref:uncharacterized protein n=1 Tax=Pocillopora verrucosa TaxID=203993 RepID=UPI0033404442
MNFKSLVEWSVETLSLWQVLNEYNIEDVILHLDTTIRDRLKHVKFRDLATKGQKRYRQVTHQINLELICSLFESVRFYDGVIFVCCAKTRSPGNGFTLLQEWRATW